MSVADFLLPVLLLVWWAKNELKIPIFPVVLFGGMVALLLINAVFIVPVNFNMPVQYFDVISDFSKFVVVFLYFIIGYQIERLDWTGKLFRSFILGAVIIGIIGLLVSWIWIPLLSDRMWYAGIRLNGWMNDPNYYAVVQCIALVTVLRIEEFKRLRKLLLIALLLLTIISSGSKTGFLTIAAVMMFFVWHEWLDQRLGMKHLLSFTFLLLIGLILTPPFLQNMSEVFDFIGQYIPSVQRIELLLSNFSSAISEDGSGRTEVWDLAVQLIKSSPLIGVSVGNYYHLGKRLHPDPNVAHNTFLQLFAEWGIPITCLLIIFLIFLILRKLKKSTDKRARAIQQALLIFSVSSMSVSFNNSRLFWLIIGIASA